MLWHPGDFPTGSYVMQFLLDGQIAGTAAFTVVSSLSPYLSHAAPLYWCVGPAKAFCASPFGSLASQTAIKMICWREGRTFVGNYKSSRWFYVVADGAEGFIHSSWVEDQIAAPKCSSIGWIAAIDWASARIGAAPPKTIKTADGMSFRHTSG